MRVQGQKVHILYMMPIVAVAGGTSLSLGRCIVTSLLQTNHRPIILSRGAASNGKPDQCYGAEVRYVDYTSEASLRAALSDVETVISVLKIPGPEWCTCQINLLNAAKAAGVKRFAPSEFEAGPLAADRVDFKAFKSSVWKACEESELECARFCCGMFMNYLAFGSEKDDLTEGLVDEPIIWNNAKCTAELPVKDDGQCPLMTMTELSDIGRFVAAACALPLGKWQPTMGIRGDNVRADEVLKIIESRRGKTYQVTKLHRADLQKRADSIEGPGKNREQVITKIVAQIELMLLDEQPDMGLIDPVVNQLCSQIQPISVFDFLKKVYP